MDFLGRDVRASAFDRDEDRQGRGAFLGAINRSYYKYFR